MGRMLGGAALLLVSRASEHSCAIGESCSESSVLLQRVNRKARQLPMKVAVSVQGPQVNSDDFSAVDLYQSALELFRTGASPAVIEFTNDTLEALESMVMPELLHGYHEDMQMLEEAVGRVHEVLEMAQENREELHEIRLEEADVTQEHRHCREAQRTECHDAEECVAGCSQLNQTYITLETNYFAIAEIVKRQWCEVNGNKSDPVWRTEMQTQFHHYIEVGEERIHAKADLDDCMSHCIDATRSRDAVGHECNDWQEQMEHMSCLAEATRLGMNDDVQSAWEIETESFNDVMEYVRPREEHRHHDFKALKAVKCLLIHIVNRAGRPCDEVTEPGLAEHIIEECESFWQIDTHPALNPWNLTYPELPDKPDLLAEEPHPCTHHWLSEQYAAYSGACFADMLSCWPCHGHSGHVESDPNPVHIEHDLLQASAQPTSADVQTSLGADAAGHSSRALVMMDDIVESTAAAAQRQQHGHGKSPAYKPPTHLEYKPPKHLEYKPPKHLEYEPQKHPAHEPPKKHPAEHPSSHRSPAVVLTERQPEPPKHPAYKPPKRPEYKPPKRPAFERPKHPSVMTSEKGTGEPLLPPGHPTRPALKPLKRPAHEQPKPGRHPKPYKHPKPPYKHPSVV